MRYLITLMCIACTAESRPSDGGIVHDCPIMDTADTYTPGIVITAAPAGAVVLAWECAAADVDCVSATTGLDARGWWRASCSGDAARPVLVVRWWVSP